MSQLAVPIYLAWAIAWMIWELGWFALAAAAAYMALLALCSWLVGGKDRRQKR